MENLHDKFATAELSQYLSSAEELIEEARNGRMFILVDDEDRENEGDLVVPAQFASHTRRFAVHASAERSNVNVGLSEHRLRRCSQGQYQPVFSDGKSNPWGWGAAERFGQAVVSSSAKNCVLGT